MARDAILRLVADGDVPWLAATIMPDHVHVLFELGDRLSLDRLLAKIKGLVTRSIAAPLPIWQENAFEHRLRSQEESEDYGFYIFMNPYRAGLLQMDAIWPGWICTEPARFRFLDTLKSGGILPTEWLGRVETVAGRIASGE
jgi:putative transposase